MDFFGIGFGEIILVLIVALLVFGPGKIPEISRTIGRISRNLRKATSDFTSAMEREADELKQPLKDAAETKRDLTVPPPDSPSRLPPPGADQPKGQ